MSRYLAAELTELAHSIGVIDVHQHLGSWRGLVGQEVAAEFSVEHEVELRHELMNRYCLESSFLMPSVHHDGSPESICNANDEVVRLLGASPRFKAGMFSLPLRDAEQSVAEMDRAVANGLRGLTLHHRFAGKHIDTPIMWPLLEGARRHGVPVLVHCLYESALESLWRVEKLADDFPELKFVALLSMMTPAAVQQAVHIAKRYRNIYFETAAMTASAGTSIELMYRGLGVGRLVYGSDLYADPPSYYFPGVLFEILALPIPLDAKRAILRGNALELFGLPDA